MVEDGIIAGLISYAVNNDECEIVSLNSLSESKDMDSALLGKVIDKAKELNLRRVFLITANDNSGALKFFRKRGFRITAVYLNAVRESRKIKPEIPLTGNDGTPIEHEIELEYLLQQV